MVGSLQSAGPSSAQGSELGPNEATPKAEMPGKKRRIRISNLQNKSLGSTKVIAILARIQFNHNFRRVTKPTERL
jgi:hypothetical protein